MKRGRFSADDIKFIEQNCEALSPEAIAEHIERDVSSVINWIERNIGFSDNQKKEVEASSDGNKISIERLLEVTEEDEDDDNNEDKPLLSASLSPMVACLTEASRFVM